MENGDCPEELEEIRIIKDGWPYLTICAGLLLWSIYTHSPFLQRLWYACTQDNQEQITVVSSEVPHEKRFSTPFFQNKSINDKIDKICSEQEISVWYWCSVGKRRMQEFKSALDHHPGPDEWNIRRLSNYQKVFFSDDDPNSHQTYLEGVQEEINAYPEDYAKKLSKLEKALLTGFINTEKDDASVGNTKIRITPLTPGTPLFNGLVRVSKAKYADVTKYSASFNSFAFQKSFFINISYSNDATFVQMEFRNKAKGQELENFMQIHNNQVRYIHFPGQKDSFNLVQGRPDPYSPNQNIPSIDITPSFAYSNSQLSDAEIRSILDPLTNFIDNLCYKGNMPK